MSRDAQGRSVVDLTLADSMAEYQKYSYACSLHATGTLTLDIAPPPAAGLPRLRWRLASLVSPS
jgi:hypothetical protein